MHETSQQQRVNNSMSIDSFSTLSLSKLTLKKTTFYKHDDPSKLNYYARFSPKRKTLNEEFEQIILKGEAPLSPKASRVSSSSKKSFKSVTKKVFKDQSHQRQKNNFELIVPSSLFSANKTNTRSEIYIDEDEESSSDELHNDNFLHNTTALISNNGLQNGFHHKTNFLEISLQQNPRQFSESQESSSFERMIEPSSSQDNDVPYVSVSKTLGGQMLIEDDDSEPESQQNLKKIDVQTPMKIIEGSEQKILELAKSIGAYKQHEIPKSVKSQNISFSVDSDLSFMEQNWNSYFQTSHDDETSDNEVSQRQILSENLISQDISNQQFLVQNNHNMSSSSEEELPSFSHPDTQCYHITSKQSRNPSIYSQDAYHMIDLQTETQAKQFKRQFTFGNELTAGFEENSTQSQHKPKSKQPLFKKFLKKSVLENFKSKDFNKKQKDKNPTLKAKTPSILHEKLTISQKSKVKKALSSNEKKTISRNVIIPMIQEPKKEEEMQDQKIILTEDFHRSQSKKGDEILIVDEQMEKERKNNYMKQNAPKQIQILDLNQEKQSQKAQNRVKWQNAMKPIVETQKKGKQASSSIKQKLEKVKEKVSNQIKIDQEDEIEQKNCPTEYRRISFDKTEKFPEQNSYLKIFSEKKFHRIRKGSYNDRAKISQNQYQISEFEENSENGKKYSQPKSQRCESITTATQEMSQNTQFPPHYFLKNKQNCISQVENLKKYLQKIQIPQLREKQKTTEISNNFEIHENFQVYGSQKDGISESDQNSFSEMSQSHEDQNQKHQQKLEVPQINSKDDSSMRQTSNPIYPESYQPKSSLKILQNQSQIDTPIKQLKKESEAEKDSHLQKKQETNSIKKTQITKHRGFQQSLTVLEEMIRTESSQLTRVYEKIYTQVNQQELKYQQRLKKQESLINLMQSFIQASSKKIDGQKFLSQESSSSNELQVVPPQQDRNRVQILINKHIIFSLVRNIALTGSKSSYQK